MCVYMWWALYDVCGVNVLVTVCGVDVVVIENCANVVGIVNGIYVVVTGKGWLWKLNLVDVWWVMWVLLELFL